MPKISTGIPKNFENSLRTTASQWPSIGQAIGLDFRLLVKIKTAKENHLKPLLSKINSKMFPFIKTNLVAGAGIAPASQGYEPREVLLLHPRDISLNSLFTF